MPKPRHTCAKEPLQLIDLVIVATYLLTTLGLSIWFSRSNHSQEDHFLAGRRLPWWALAVSTMATQSSANSFIGIPAFVALVPGGGLTWLQYELALPLAMLFVMVAFVPVFRRLGLVSIYEYLEVRFDRPTRLWLSAVFLVSRSLATGVALYAAAVVVQVCTGLPLFWSTVLMGGITLAYDLLGGMRAVVWTDVLQMLVLLAGLCTCAAFAWQLAGGWDGVQAAVPVERLQTLDFRHGLGDGAGAPMWGFVVGGFVLYVAYYGVDQSQAQRQFSASSVPDAQRLLAFNALARFPLTLLYAMLGLLMAAAYARSPELRAAVPAERLDFLVPRFIEIVLPTGLRGLLVAAVLAAAMSSLDSSLNGLAAATMRDFAAGHVPPRRAMLATRCITVFWGLLITAVALQAHHFSSNVVEGINRVGALFYGPLLAAFGLGIFDRQATGQGVRLGVLAGLGANLLLLLMLGSQLFWMWWNVAGAVVAVATAWLWSRGRPLGAGHSADANRSLSTVAHAWRSCRGWAWGLLLYSALIFGMLWALPGWLAA